MASALKRPASRSPRDIYETLRSRLEAGEFGEGSPFPTEEKLCAAEGVSRYALREALSMLEADGLIRRRRGAGTTVISRTRTGVFRHATGSRADLINYVEGTHVRWNPIRRVHTSGQLARLLGCDEMREWQQIDGIRYDQQSLPLALVEVYIDPARVLLPSLPELADEPVYEWIARTTGLQPMTLSQDIRARPLAAAEAQALGEVEGASVLQMIRRYFDADETLYQISVTTHRARDFVYNLRIQLRD